MKLKLPSIITLILSCLLFIAAVSSMLLTEKYSVLPPNLFFTSLLFISITLVLEYKNIVATVSMRYHWFGPRQMFRTIVATLLLVLAIVTTYRHNHHFDWTEEHFYSLSQDSIQFWKNFSFTIRIVASPNKHGEFFNAMKRFEELLASQNIPIEWLDPVREPSSAKKLKIHTVPCMQILIKDKEPVTLTENQLFGKKGSPMSQKLVFYGESVLTQALIRSKSKSKLTLWAPHLGKAPFINDAPNGYSVLPALLEQEGFEVVQSSELPSHTSSSTLIALLPLDTLAPELQNSFRLRIENNLPTIILFESQPENPLPFLADLGVFVHRFPVLDPMLHVQNDAAFFTPLITKHPIHESLGIRPFPIYMLGATGFTRNEKIARNSHCILKTSNVSWIETNLKSEQSPSYEPEKDIKGPIETAVEITPSVLAFGDQDMLQNQFLQQPGPRTLLLNSLHYITGNLELMTERGKSLPRRVLKSTQKQNRTAIVILLFILPALCIAMALGLSAWKQKGSSRG